MNMRKTLTTNIDEMGLVFDINKSMGLPNNRRDRVNLKKRLVNGFVEEDQSGDEDGDGTSKKAFPKQHVVDQLEADSKELRESKFRLPKGIVKFVSYLVRIN